MMKKSKTALFFAAFYWTLSGSVVLADELNCQATKIVDSRAFGNALNTTVHSKIELVWRLRFDDRFSVGSKHYSSDQIEGVSIVPTLFHKRILEIGVNDGTLKIFTFDLTENQSGAFIGTLLQGKVKIAEVRCLL